jgi:hypothetical protein
VLWDPDRADGPLFHQSARLYVQFYLIQMTVHRPFMDSTDNALSLSALAICKSAARSCVRVVDVEQRRSNKPRPYHIVRPFFRVLRRAIHYTYRPQGPVFTAGMLLLDIRGRRDEDLDVDFSEELKDVDNCLNALKCCEPA